MNQRTLVSLFFIFFFLISSQAQSPQRLLFKLTDQQVEQLLTKPNSRIYLPGDKVAKKRLALVLEKPIAKIPAGQQPVLENQEPGSYFLTTVQGDRILGELYVKSEIESFQVIPAGSSSLVYIQANGKNPADVSVFFSGKKLRYDEDAAAYVITSKKPDGLLKVQTDRETRLFFYHRGHPEKVKNYYIYNANGDFLAETSRGGKRAYYGYLLVSQPRYRPGDTLRIKALIFDKKGNPQTAPFELYCSATRKSMATIYAKRPGLYLLDVPLKDSLGWKLDGRYSLRVRETSGKKHYLLDYVYFKYEDYELDESKFSLRTDKSVYHPGDSVQVFAQMEDANGVPLPGGVVTIEISFANLGSDLPEELYLPLTWLKDTFELNTGAKPVVVIPKGKILNTTVTYHVKAYFRATNNELKTEYTQFSIQPKKIPEKLIHRWKNDTLLLDYQSDSIKIGILTTLVNGSGNYMKMPLLEKEIHFPFFLKVNPNVSLVQIVVGKKTERIDVPEPPISAEKYRRGDSIFFKINNPWNWPITFDIQKQKKVLAEGNIVGNWQWEGISADEAPVILRYRYFYQNRPVSREAVLMVAEGRLNVKVEQPDRIEPGDSVDIQVTVTDDFGHFMPEVDLTAWAVNNQFPDDNAPNVYAAAHKQRIKYERERGSLHIPYYNIRQGLRQHHIKSFGLDSIDTYRMRFPDSVAYRYIPLADTNRMEFAPFMYQNGRQIQIHLLYINAQLVYFSGASNLAPFSFHMFTDTADVRIRWGKYAYQLKDVVFKKGFKTEISFNPTNLPSFIQQVERGDTLTTPELKQLNNSLVWMEKGWPDGTDVTLWQLGNTIILPQYPRRYVDNKQRYCIGPLQTADLAIALRGMYGRYLDVRPGYSYKPGEYEMMVEPIEPLTKTILQKNWKPYNQMMGNVAMLPSDIVLDKREIIRNPNMARKQITEEFGKVMLNYGARRDVQVYVRTCDDPLNIWPIGGAGMHDLAAGCYNFIFRNSIGKTAIRDSVFIRNKELFILNPEDLYANFVFDTLLNRVLSSNAQIIHQGGKDYALNKAMWNGNNHIKGSIPDVKGAEVLFFRDQRLALHKRTNANGEFEVHNIAKGRYDVLVLHPDYQLFWKFKEVKEGLNTWDIQLIKTDHDSLQANLRQALQEDQYVQLLENGDMGNRREANKHRQFDLIFTRNDLPLEPQNDFFEPFTYPARERTIQWYMKNPIPKISHIKEGDFGYERPFVLDPDFFKSLTSGSTTRCKDCAMGQVWDANTKEPLVGVVVMINGTNIGTLTDSKGYFYLKSPKPYGQLKINFIGYQPRYINYSVGMWKQIRLNEADFLMESVVVSALNGKVAGVSISRGNAPLFKGRKKKSGGNFQELEEKRESLRQVVHNPRRSSNKDSFLVNSDKDGIADYDDIEPGGIPAQFGDTLGGLMPPAPIDFTSLRQDFRDNAYWRPDLLTDAKGQARIRVKMPDDITGWKTHVYAMNSKLQVGRKDGLIQSLKQLTARLSLPRFMVEGDSAMLIGRVINYGEEADIQTAFGLTEDDISRHDTTVGELLIEQYPVVADVEPPLFGGELGAPFDTLKPRFLLIRKNGDLDGEIRDVPIFPQGVLENNGSFFYLEGDTSVTFSPQAGEGKIELIARNNPLQVLLQDLNYLVNYRHDCNEQMASRLTAMRLARDVRTALALPDANRNDINKLKRRLHRSQNPDGSWGWWPGNGGTLWMTAYVAASLHQNDPKDPRLNKAFGFLRDSMAVRFGHYHRSQMLTLLVRMAEMDAVTDYGFFFDRLAIDTVALSDYEQLLELRLRQLTVSENKPDIQFVLDKAQRSALGGQYWGRKGWRWHGGDVEHTLLAYKILRHHGGQEADLQRIRAYFFETRQRHGWRNTIESASILGTIVPDFVGASKQPQAEAQLALAYNGQNRLITDWPARMTLDDYENGSIQLQKQGNAPVFVSLYQSRWERDPDPVDSLFSIQTHLVQDKERTEQLTTGQNAELVISLHVKKSASFLSLEVPIPAGCSYGDKGGNHYREVHREYRKEKVNIYFRSLPAGKYTFKINLEPRYSGRYTLNPAKAEMMYEPVFYGRNRVADVQIGELEN